MPITDAELLLRCENPRDLDPSGKGICKGMVMMFIRAAMKQVDYQAWLPADLKTGHFVDPDRRAGFYMNAQTMHIRGLGMAAALRARIPDPDANERSLVPTMYDGCGLEAVELTAGFVDVRHGYALVTAVLEGLARRLDVFHISLRNADSGHSVAVWRMRKNEFVLFDPNGGVLLLKGPQRLCQILLEEFQTHGEAGEGQFSEYTRVCCWGIEISAAALPVPPPPPPDGKGH
jgi:hypothetical protein